MAKVPIESLSARIPASFRPIIVNPASDQASTCSFRTAQSIERRNSKFYKELGLFSLKKKIENTVKRAEMIAHAAMELEEERKIKQEVALRTCNLWDNDISTSIESLTDLADNIKLVNDLKEVLHKAEEAKLITQLAEMDIINHHLFKQAYTASLDVSKFLDHYEISKLLRGPYDKEGACMIIKAGMEGTASEMWTEKLLNMYTRWAKKHGCNVMCLEAFPSLISVTKSATIEFEKEYMYGYLSGEKGIHKMIHSSFDGFTIRETWSASIDVIPLYLGKMVDFHIDDTDLEILFPSHEATSRRKNAVGIRHIPSNTVVECSGERSQFANKMKALNRLKAKLHVLQMEERPETGVTKNGTASEECEPEARRYMIRPKRSVHDVKTGVVLHDLNSVLSGNIEPFIRARVGLRRPK
ncbi:hypothetical protein KSP39_PZI017585 [Platanthera zijinensis]|uniref:Peptide chain release factor domain-containing protein n=1 Tax=Platanthera zijinensis TaxID=2320716 RepID=A0AAP0B4G6_9ASPA